MAPATPEPVRVARPATRGVAGGERAVRGRHPAAGVAVVHDVVVDQRGGLEELHRAGQPHQRRRSRAGRPRGSPSRGTPRAAACRRAAGTATAREQVVDVGAELGEHDGLGRQLGRRCSACTRARRSAASSGLVTTDLLARPPRRGSNDGLPEPTAWRWATLTAMAHHGGASTARAPRGRSPACSPRRGRRSASSSSRPRTTSPRPRSGTPSGTLERVRPDVRVGHLRRRRHHPGPHRAGHRADRPRDDADPAGPPHLRRRLASPQLRQVVGPVCRGGVRNILALRGDPPGNVRRRVGRPPRGPQPRRPSSSRLIRDAGRLHHRRRGVPRRAPRRRRASTHDVEVLVRKADAGASFAITQMVFDADSYLRLRDAVARPPRPAHHARA